jgi:hypothetical protein
VDIQIVRFVKNCPSRLFGQDFNQLVENNMKMKTFISNSVFLSDVPKEHRSANGNCQYATVVRAKTKKRVAELLECSYGTLVNFYGCHEAGPNHIGIPQKDETIYYRVEHTKTGFVGEWFEYIKK